ncbi:ATP-binding protein [Planktothricoides raciborskii]|uniref:ATP-binding protein n=1 Tax=Planktothricoides raciborskii GIHE-MW2 TaxID=2792601 RepID=A0AAU8JF56_9CYAN
MSSFHDPKFLDELYNVFEPFNPLSPGDPQYVDCREVRGDGDILEELGNKIRRSQRMTCQLYAGHRGAGKSTELLRLKQYLEQNQFLVVYFAADEADIDPEDAEYADILLACTRHILEDLKDIARPDPLTEWLRGRWQELKDLALTEVKFETLSVEGQIAQFAKLTANLRAVPSLRRQIRDKINPYTVTLTQALNEFIAEAKNNLPNGCEKLAVIVDNLDRMVLIPQDNGRTNHEEIFIDRSEQLRSLDCHLVYTVPISLVYSRRSTDLRDIYSDPQVLPMIMVQNPDETTHQPGVDKLTEIITKRVERVAKAALESEVLTTEIFESAEVVQRLCLMSGGHVRNLLLLIQAAINRTHQLPISKKEVQRAITEARDTYRRTVEHDEWQLLAQVHRSKQIINEDQTRNLLFNRCLLEYRYLDNDGELQRWSDVHPLIKNLPEFKAAVAALEKS